MKLLRAEKQRGVLAKREALKSQPVWDRRRKETSCLRVGAHSAGRSAGHNAVTAVTEYASFNVQRKQFDLSVLSVSMQCRSRPIWDRTSVL